MSPTDAEVCSKCGRLLPPSQQACVFGGMIVCAECDKVLRSKQAPQPAPLPKPSPGTRKGIMKSEMRRFTPAIYGLTLICFFLPFTHISCEGRKVASLTGIQLVTGTSVTVEGKTEKIDPEPLAILLLCTAVVGLAVETRTRALNGNLLKSELFVVGLAVKTRTRASIIVGVIGLTLLLFLKAEIDSEVLKRGEGVLKAEYAVGFWLMLISFFGAIAINTFLQDAIRAKAERILKELFSS